MPKNTTECSTPKSTSRRSDLTSKRSSNVEIGIVRPWCYCLKRIWDINEILRHEAVTPVRAFWWVATKAARASEGRQPPGLVSGSSVHLCTVTHSDGFKFSRSLGVPFVGIITPKIVLKNPYNVFCHQTERASQATPQGRLLVTSIEWFVIIFMSVH